MKDYTISFNIGYDTGQGNSSIITRYPELFKDVTIREFTDIIRTSCQAIFSYSEAFYIPPSSIHLYVIIQKEDDEYEISIKMMNVREYKTIYNNWLEARK